MYLNLVIFCVVTLAVQKINVGLAERCITKGRIHMLSTIMSWGYVFYAFHQGWQFVVAFIVISLYVGSSYLKMKARKERVEGLIKEGTYESVYINQTGREDRRLLTYVH